MQLHLPSRSRGLRLIQSGLAAAFVAGFAAAAPQAQAQDSSALIDVLVKKGVLSNKEADDVRTELTKEAADNPANKIKLSNSVTELKLYGDLRLRYQYDDRQQQVADAAHVSQRSLYRFRLRINAEAKLGEHWFAGFSLGTGQAADSEEQTFENGFDDYNIFITRAYLGWQPTDWFTTIAGKQKNPFYTTDLVWDADITPTGVTEQIAFHKLDLFGGAGGPSGDAKDGKTFVEPPKTSPWEVTLVAGQFIFDDNLESAADSDASTDAWLFTEQLIVTYKFNKNTSLTIAPAFNTFTAADLTGLTNANAFTDSTVSGETRQLHIITAPGDLSFKIGGVKTKIYWDAAYNFGGRKRFQDIYELYNSTTQVGTQYSERDGFAWLAGIQLGELKKRGDWQAYVNYRETGIASVDPNLNDSTFALGELNTRGFKIGLAYQLADAVVFSATGYIAWNLNEDLVGGRATASPSIADGNAINVVQLDLAVKF